MKPSHSKTGWILLAIALALALRLGLLLLAIAQPGRTLEADSNGYLAPAQALLEYGWYAHPGGMRMPLYPAFLALLQALFGQSLVAVVAAQALLGLGTVLLTWQLGGLLAFPRYASFLAALLLAFSLESLFSPFFILSDTLFTFLLLAASCTLVRFLRSRRLLWLVLTALLTGLVTLCRPIAIAFGLVSLVILLGFDRASRFRRRLLHAAVFAALLFGLFILPWSWRNAQVVGVPTLTTESDLYWQWGAATVNADLQGISVDQAKIELDQQVEATLAARSLEASEANLYAVRNEISQGILRAHPLRFFLLTLRYDLRSFLPGMGYAVKYLGLSQGSTEGLEVLEGSGLQGVVNNYFSGQAAASLIFLPFLALLGFLYLGAAGGFIELLRKRDWLGLAVLLLPVGYLLLISGYSANSRYRVPAAPFLALLAGVGLPMLWGWVQRLGKKKEPHA